MIKNYIKIAFRNLWRHKGFSFINIFGLAIGIATCIIIMLFVQYELSYDKYNKKADRIVRVVFRGQVKGERMNEANVFPPVAQTLLKDFPEVQEATRMSYGGSPMVSYGDKTFKENSIVYVDPNFFKIFTLPLLQGDINTALSSPNTMVITSALAIKYFGGENPIGKILTFKSLNTSYKITGVIDKVPDNSHFHFEMFGTMIGNPDALSTSWMSSNFYTYLVLPEGYNYKRLEAKLPGVVNKYMEPQLQHAMGISLSEFRAGGSDIGLYLQPLTDIHLHSNFTNDFEAPGDISYIYIFSAIAIFMLLIACINFMNLSTASASGRAREVGIRKVMGAVKGKLIGQFLVESILLTAFALVLAIVFVQLALPAFNQFAGRQLSLQLTTHPWLVPGLLTLGLVTGIFAGSYPAFFLSSFNPVEVLKGRFIAGKGGSSLRSGLVVFQFFISITLMVSTAVVYNQLSYIQNKKLGYNKDQVLILPESWMLGDNKVSVLRQQLEQDPRVASVTSTGYIPAGPSNSNNFFVYEENAASQIKALRYEVDYNYLATLGIEMTAGRYFSKNFATDSSAVVLNEAAVKALGFGNQALGKTITRADNDAVKTTWRVIGIVKDFHFKSLHELISPLVMTLSHDNGTLLIKTKTKDLSGLLKTTKMNWDKLSPEMPFSYSFLDERFNNTYRSEQNTAAILGVFAGLAIFVACLGLFGLATFMAQKRVKEIGIRKVLGANVRGIVTLLSKDFLKLVVIAFVVAAPVAWFIMNKWLQDFAYRISISWWIFGLAGLVTVGVTLITVSIQSIKSALTNPVKSLKME
ncbi:MAG: ABC transporter permease [Flavitalea sp.]